MNLFIERHQLLLKVLLDFKVEFIIVGGYSVIYHGYKRTTGDVDIWLKPDNENREKIIRVFTHFNIGDKQSLAQVEVTDFTKPIVFSIWEEPEKIDFMTYIQMVSYKDANELKIMAPFEGLIIPFLHIHHLILSKMTSGRAKDQADVEELQKIQKRKEP